MRIKEKFPIVESWNAEWKRENNVSKFYNYHWPSGPVVSSSLTMKENVDQVIKSCLNSLRLGKVLGSPSLEAPKVA